MRTETQQQNEGEMLRDRGLERVLESHPDFVEIMQDEVIKIVNHQGEVSAIDARQRAAELGIKPVHPNAWGAVFRDSRLKFLRFHNSTIASRHCGVIRIWTLA